MTLRHLRYFVAVAEQGSVARAARMLRVAQPALSRQIHDFERFCGRELFSRHSQGLRLTPEGTALLPRARHILAGLDEAVRHTRRAHAGEVGEVRIGMNPSVIESPRVSRALTAVREAFPGLSLNIRKLQSDAQPAALHQGEVDVAIGIAGSPPVDLVRSRVLFADAVCCAIVPASHRFAAAIEISIAELRATPLIHFTRTTVRAFPEVNAAMARAGLEIAEEHDTTDAVYWQVAAGKGWALGLDSMRGRAPAGTAVVRLSDFQVDLSVVARARATDDSPTVSRVIDALAAALAEPPRRVAAGFPETDSGPAVSGIELRHLEALIAVCETRSLHAGAKRLGISQSGVSRRVSALEKVLGLPLLEHVGHGVIATIAGRTLAGRAGPVVLELEAALRASMGAAGRCRFGLVPTQANERVLVDVIREMGDEALEVTEMISSDVEDGVRRGRIDVGISHAFVPIDDPTIETLALSDDALDCALLPVGHPLAGRPRIAAADLANEPFLFVARQETPRLYDRILNELERVGLRPSLGPTVSSPRAIRGMVAAAMGWTVGLRSQRQGDLPGVVGVPIEGMHVAAGLQLVWRRHERDARTLGVVRAFKNWKLAKAQGITAPAVAPALP